jgi:hypothetical protein
LNRIIEKTGKIFPGGIAAIAPLRIQLKKSLDRMFQNGLVDQPQLLNDFGELLPLSPARFAMADSGFDGCVSASRGALP